MMMGKWSRTRFLWVLGGGSGSHVGVLEATNSHSLQWSSAWRRGRVQLTCWST